MSRPLDNAGRKYSMLLGIVMAGQMDGLIQWTRSDQFTPARLNSIPKDVELLRETALVFRRIVVEAYIDGVGSTARAGRPRPVAALSRKALRHVQSHGIRLAAAALHGVRTQVMPILEAVWTPDGTRVKDQASLEKEIRSVYATILRPGSKRDLDAVLQFAASDNLDKARDTLVRSSRRGRSMKVRDPQQREKYLRTRVPFTKWLKRTVEQIRAEAVAPPTLSPEFAVRWVETEAARFKSAGVIEATRTAPDVVAYRFVASNGGSSAACRAANGMVIRKDDPQLSNWMPPLHHGCQSHLEPIYAEDDVKVTARKDRPDIDVIAKGFGKVAKQAPLTVAGQR